MTTLDVLKAARARISNPDHWTQREGARGVDGQPRLPEETTAVCWCAVGAIEWAMPYNNAMRWACYDALDGGKALGPHVLAHYNDNHTHAEVLALYDAAIARLEGGQA